LSAGNEQEKLGGAKVMRTADEIGKKLKVSGRYVRKLAEGGKIPVVRVGPRALRFDEKEVIAALKLQPRVGQEEQLG
jgi:excisionase family DNA binding protein